MKNKRLDNQNALKHGGGAAVQRIREGGAFTGPAKDKQELVIQELDQVGIDAIMERNAIRLQTAADLYFDVLVKAAQDGDEERVDRYSARFGWLTAKTQLAWKDVRQARKTKGTPALDAVLRDYESSE